MKRFYYFFLPLLICLAACSMPGSVGPDLQTSSAKFCEAMRWRDTLGAANFLEGAARETFLAQFDDDNLHVVDSQVVAVLFDESAEGATVDYQLEYYLLPSSRIKKWRWQQRWQLASNKAAKISLWMIQNPPPAFP